MTELWSLDAGCFVLTLVELEMVPRLSRGDGGDGVELPQKLWRMAVAMISLRIRDCGCV